MKQYICEIIRTSYINKSHGYDNSKEHRDFLYINPNTFIGSCGKRYHTIYCDKHFLDDEKGQMLVRKVFEPMANLKDGKGIIFV